MNKLLEKIDREDILKNVRDRGETLIKGLELMKSKYTALGDVRGIGLMAAVEFCTPEGSPDVFTCHKAAEAAEKNGLMLIESGGVLRIAPPLNVSEAEIQEGLTILDKSISEAAT